MRLCNEGLRDKKIWESKGYKLPAFDRDEMLQNTSKEPTWVHFGGGNLFRAFHAALAQDMLEAGLSKEGIIVIEGYDYEIISKSYRENDNISLLATLKADGSVEKTVIGAISESCILDSADAKEYGRLKEIFGARSLQLATFTITEKGYSILDNAGNLMPAILADFEAGPEMPKTYIGKVASLLYARFVAGRLPIAMVSTDNCSHNGDKLYNAINAFAEAWEKNGTASAGFLEYVNDKSSVAFPWSMIDKITPRPDASVEAILTEDGLEGLEPVVTSKGTYIAPFVNAEETQYLVIEDAFPNGRPALDRVGVIFTQRETVDKVEKMKVCTCLNPIHTALAVYGCILGYTRISDEMKDEDLLDFVKKIGYAEGLPVVVNPGVLDPKEFIDTVINVRVPNPFMPDTPQRIATDTSQKLSIRFGETIKKYIEVGMDIARLKRIPLVFAGWMRYLMAVNDEGERFELSSDPMLTRVCPYFENVRLGDKITALQLSELLHDSNIWGNDLIEIGMADKVVQYFNMLNEGPGAVRRVLANMRQED